MTVLWGRELMGYNRTQYVLLSHGVGRLCTGRFGFYRVRSCVSLGYAFVLTSSLSDKKLEKFLSFDPCRAFFWNLKGLLIPWTLSVLVSVLFMMSV